MPTLVMMLNIVVTAIEAADVGNAYLEATSNEKVCFVAGESFAKYGLKGHLLIIHKALYGLRNSGACYHAKWADSMNKLGFFPSRSDPDVWMRPATKADGPEHFECKLLHTDYYVFMLPFPVVIWYAHFWFWLILKGIFKGFMYS